MDRRGLVLDVFLIFVCFSTILKAEKDGSCETQCGNSCCPHENAVCCEGDSFCCKQGQTCLSSIDTCIGLKPSTHGNVTLHSEKATPVAGIYCPSGTTSCEGECCPYEDAVCCNDGFCCPNGYTCTKDTCASVGVRNKTMRSRIAGTDPAINMMGRKLKDMGIQICPDKLHLCPGNADCCRKDNGQWDCCPKTSKLQTGECCNIFGIYMCCTDLAAKCHWYGCWF